ncbi:hypothetical protein Cantr_04676 [Candida viswanathii]|uniref:Zn(2)-C6 fungal-type domain-containing protein n=1 Tax=Candida viswanathii TaxID=5486 RepID=A0A367XPK6_9ASCO|nr:hypothetical protein Cantr_04676 [Candida viswanathii]
MNSNPDNNYTPLLKDESLSTINSSITTATTGSSSITPGQFPFDTGAVTSVPAVESALTNFFSGANTKQSSITKLTNRHTTSKNPRKKRGVNIRACDACALKKVKCDTNRPCNHCQANRIACTQNRERKKSGPKTLTKKALESINKLSEVIEKNTNGNKRPELGKRTSSRSFSRSPSDDLMDEDITGTEQPTGEEARSTSHSISPVLSTGSSATPNPNVIKQEQQQHFEPMHQHVLQELKTQYPSGTNSTLASALGSTVNLAATDIEEYIVSPFHLIENLTLIGEEPAIHELIKPLSTPTVIERYVVLVDFLKSHYPDRQDNETGYNPRHEDLNFVEHHDDSLYLSTLLVILTLNQIVAEILIKLKKQKFKGLRKYPKKYLLFRPFKHFKNLCHYKLLEVLTLVEKNFIVPPTIPQNRINIHSNSKGQNVVGNSNANSNSPNNLLLFLHLNQYEIYYNLSLALIQLCNYYHILNLTNTLNSTNLSSNNYGNEAQEHQKILTLHRAITFFLLINLRSNDQAGPVTELYELIYSFERYYLVLSSHNYNINVTRNNVIILHLQSASFQGKEYIYELMQMLTNQGLINDLCYRSNFNVLLDYAKPVQGYYDCKSQIKALTPVEPIHQVIENIILFKILLTKPLTFSECKHELVEILTNLNSLLEANNNDIFKVKLSNYQILQPMLHCLKIFLEIKTIEVKSGFNSNKIALNDQMILVKFSDNLILHFPFFNNINKLIRAHKILNNWFLNLSEIRKDDEQQQQHDPLRPEQPQPRTPAQLPTLPEVSQLQTVPQFPPPQQPPQQAQFSPAHMPQGTPQHIDGALLSYEILPLTPSLHQTNLQMRIASQIDLQGLLDFDSMLQNNNLNVNANNNNNNNNDNNANDANIASGSTNISPPIPVVHQGHQADDEEDEEDNGFMSITPLNQHGHKFLNNFDTQAGAAGGANNAGPNVNNSGVPIVNNPAPPSDVNNPPGATGSVKSSESFTYLFNW